MKKKKEKKGFYKTSISDMDWLTPKEREKSNREFEKASLYIIEAWKRK
jgi:hypothetical protein